MNTLKKEYSIEEGKITLVYDYEGEEIDAKTIAALDKTLSQLKSYDEVKMVSAIRTILHKSKENYLALKVKNEYLTLEIIFEEKELKMLIRKENLDSICGVETKYKANSYFDSRITGSNIGEMIKDYTTINGKDSPIYIHSLYIKTIADKIENINKMQKDLTEAVNIATYYKTFFGNDADMGEKEAENKIQIAMYLLKRFGLINTPYEFDTNYIGYEYFSMNFTQAFLPRSEEIESIRNTIELVKDINTEDTNIEDIDKIKAIADLIKEVTNLDIDKLTELAIILNIEDEIKKASTQSEETGRKSSIETAKRYEEAMKKKYSEEQITNVKSLLNTIDNKIKK